jgi:hypothetical protein
LTALTANRPKFGKRAPPISLGGQCAVTLSVQWGWCWCLKFAHPDWLDKRRRKTTQGQKRFDAAVVVYAAAGRGNPCVIFSPTPHSSLTVTLLAQPVDVTFVFSSNSTGCVKKLRTHRTRKEYI